MKKILVCLMAIIVVTNLSAQVEGTIQWNPDIDFTYQVNGEYIQISSETGYIDEPGMPQIPYCVNISYTDECSGSNTGKVRK